MLQLAQEFKVDIKAVTTDVVEDVVDFRHRDRQHQLFIGLC